MNKILSRPVLTSLFIAGLLCACSPTTKLPSVPSFSESKKLDGSDVDTVKGVDGSEDTVITKKLPDGTETHVIKAKYANGAEIEMDLGDIGSGDKPPTNMMPIMHAKGPDGATVNADLMGTEGVAYSPDFPLKQYPASTVTYCGLAGDQSKGMAEMSTTDPGDKVGQFYRDELSNQGWKVVSESGKPTGNDKLANQVHLSLTAQKDTREAHIMILDPTEGSQAVDITIEISQRYMPK